MTSMIDGIRLGHMARWHEDHAAAAAIAKTRGHVAVSNWACPGCGRSIYAGIACPDCLRLVADTLRDAAARADK